MELISIFPTTILQVKYQEDFKKEFEFIRSLEYQVQPTGVFRSKNSYLIKRPELAKLKTFFQLQLNKYCDEVIGTKSKLDITQAWLQRNFKNSYTHDHVHPNSIVSGVFYFRNDDHAGITFNKDIIDRISLPKHSVTKLNTESYTLSPQTGDLILFPSHLRHAVPLNTKEDARYCLSFNTFCFGELGEELSSTHLIMNKSFI